MGTRSLTVFQEPDGQEICVMYKQFDGYPTGHGYALQQIFGGCEIVNGLTRDCRKVANGMGCLAAQVIAYFKNKPGDIYVHSAGVRDCEEEWIYTLYCAEQTGPLRMKVQAGCVTYFGLPGTKQTNMPVCWDLATAGAGQPVALRVGWGLPRRRTDNDYLPFSMNLPTRKEWEEFGFTVPDELCQPEPKPEPNDLQRLIASFHDHAKHCHTCGGGQWICEMGEALMLGIGRAAIKESK